VFLLLAYYLYRRFQKSVLNHLPEGVAWSFALCEKSHDWGYHGNNQTGYYYKEFDQKGSHFRRVQEMFNSFGASSFEIKSVTAVYSSVLVANFVGTYRIQKSRVNVDPQLFSKQTWRNSRIAEQHLFVYDQYLNRAKLFPWNQESQVFIVPVAHGTSQANAEKICATGFAALSSLDSGYFGKGIYFTSFVMYTLPYLALHRTPTILISYVLPGNVYPVIEDHLSEASLAGKGLKGNATSHYVVTNKKGRAITEMDPEGTFDEFVIPQESQIVPAFLVQVSSSNFTQLCQQWAREVPKPDGPAGERKPSYLATVSLEESTNDDTDGFPIHFGNSQAGNNIERV